MGRYLCQSCYTIVHYGESEMHSCFFNKDDDEVYTVQPLKQSEELEGKHEETEGNHAANANENNGQICSTANRNDIEECNETNSILNEGISLLPPSRRKRKSLFLLPSKCIRGVNRQSVSKSASPTNTERDGIKDAPRKSKNPKKFESAPAPVLRVGNYSTSEMATNSVALGSASDAKAASDAGPSGIQMQSHRTEEEKRFECVFCGKAFVGKHHLQAHERTHTGDKPFVCSTCGKRFTTETNRTRHLITHTGEKLFACDFCSKRFARKDNLEVHLRTHTGEKPFRCERCGKDYADPGNYRRHLKQ